MTRFFWIAIAIYLGLVANAWAGNAVSCVQAQLVQLGYDPGPVDGQFGGKTASAFAQLKAAAPDEIAAVTAGDLTSSNAEAWCEALAASFPGVAAIHEDYRTAGGFNFDIAPDVSTASAEEIKEGLAMARAYIAKTFGEEIPADVRRRMTVKIVATGKGNQESAGGGGVATAFALGHDVPRPFFDVAHEEWSQNTRGRGWTTRADNLKSVVHEYTHGWQMVLGAIDIHSQPLGNWINEGLAEYVAYSAMADAGLIKWSDAQRFMIRAASGVETDYPLKDLGSTRTPVWAGHVGFVALDWLITDTGTGIGAIKTLADEIAAGRSQSEAFANTFGLTLADFYDQFESWRTVLHDSPDRAIAARPKIDQSAGAAQAAEAPAPGPSEAVASEQAEAWFEEAMSLDGRGEEQDAKAAELYRRAAEAGHAAAARNLGGMLGSGRGVTEDQSEAAHWFRMAAEGGDAQGQFGLATWYLPQSARDERISWLRKAVAQGHERAIASLNDMGVPLEAPAQSTAATEATAAADPQAAAKCVQAALNASGFPVGAVDGQVGNGTRAAFEKYKQGLSALTRSMPFREGSYGMWCLVMTGEKPLQGDFAPLQAQIENGAKVVLGFKIPKDASFHVVMRQGENDLASIAHPGWDAAAGEHRVAFAYDDVRQADNMCAVFEDGWMVKDQAGKTYQASCDEVVPAMATAATIAWSYDLAPPPQLVTNVVVPEPAFPDLRTEADRLVDAMENKPMTRSDDGMIAPQELAELLAGQTAVVRYLPGKSVAELHFGTDGSFEFVLDGQSRGAASTYTIHPRGWVCLHRSSGGAVTCEKYVRNGEEIYRLNAVDGRLRVEIR